MKTRLEVHEILTDILGTTGETETRVYFQPPENVKMKYPCIVYGIGAGSRTPADNKKYLYFQGYEVTYITKDPDDLTVQEQLINLEYATFERQYVADNLYHWVYFIYF